MITASAIENLVSHFEELGKERRYLEDIRLKDILGALGIPKNSSENIKGIDHYLKSDVIYIFMPNKEYHKLSFDNNPYHSRLRFAPSNCNEWLIKGLDKTNRELDFTWKENLWNNQIPMDKFQRDVLDMVFKNSLLSQRTKSEALAKNKKIENEND
jgi:hypothetical protein